MKEDLNFLLFKKPFTRKGLTEMKPLFRFQSELANEIVNLDTFYQNKSAESIRPYINQVLKPGDSFYQKPISAEMRTAIIIAIKSRLSENDSLFNSIEEEFDTAYSILKQKSDTKQTPAYESEYLELLQWQEKSNKTCVFNRDPSEAKWGRNKNEYQEVKDLLNLTIQNLFKNYEGSSNEVCEYFYKYDEKGNPKAKAKDKSPALSSKVNIHYGYRFYVPSFSTAKDVWQGIFEFILLEVFRPLYKDVPLETLFRPCKDFINNLNKLEDCRPFQFVKVFKVDGFITSVPMVYFECMDGIAHSGNKQHDALFSLVLKEEEINSVSKITGKDLDFWKDVVYYPLIWSKSRSESFNAEEVKFNDVFVHILRTISKEKLNQESI